MHEIGAGERPPGGHSAATLGLGLEQGKAVLAAVQRHLVAAQVEEHCRNRRRCDRCGASRPLKDLRPRRLTSLFGAVEVRAPRFGPCRCGIACRRSMTPAAEVMPDRCTPCTAPGSLDKWLAYAARLRVCSYQAARVASGLRWPFFSISHSAL
jgi:hypothetical protein